MSTGKVVLGVLAGAATGALLGVLFAPAKGTVLRRKIYRSGEREVEALKDKLNEFIDVITEKFEKVKEDVTEFVEDAKEKAGDVEKDMNTSKK